MAVSVVLGLVVAAYGLAGSYVTVSEQAAHHRVPLPSLVPAGIDGGVVAVVVLDLVLAWIGTPVGWLRQWVRVLSVGTIAANAVGGWPDPVAVGLHTAAPLMLLAMVEAGRTVLLRRIRQGRGTLREAVPMARWLLAPWRTWLLWRRMVLWRVTSYQRAAEVELELRQAVSVLRMHYGRGWRRRAPTDLVWMLRTGIAVERACARVQVLVSGDDPPVVRDGDCRDYQIGPLFDDADTATVSAMAAPHSGVLDLDRDQFAQASQLNEQHWVQTGRPVSAETLRKRMRIGAAKSRALARAVRTTNRTMTGGIQN